MARADIEVMARCPRRRRKRLTIVDSEVASMRVASGGEALHYVREIVPGCDHHIDVDHRLCGQTRYSCAPDVLNREGQVSQASPESIA